VADHAAPAVDVDLLAADLRRAVEDGVGIGAEELGLGQGGPIEESRGRWWKGSWVSEKLRSQLALRASDETEPVARPSARVASATRM